MKRRLLTGVLIAAVVLAAALTVSPAFAALGASVDGVDYAAGTVTVSAQADAAAHAYALYANGALVETIATDASETVTFSPRRLNAATTFRVAYLAEGGAEVGSASLPLDPKTYKPSKPRLSVKDNAVVPSTWKVSGVSRQAVSIRAKETDTGRVTTTSTGPSRQTFTLRGIKVPFGEANYKVVASNAFGTSPTESLRVFRLASGMPKKSRYVFASKKILWMFDVKKGVVIHHWPIAIGTPRTPTPTGTFKIGSARRAPGGSWGKIRRRLWRVHKGRKSTATRYYIHGNNAPWTIGTPASHGCIRMYNKHITQFKKVVPTGTTVVIK